MFYHSAEVILPSCLFLYLKAAETALKRVFSEHDRTSSGEELTLTSAQVPLTSGASCGFVFCVFLSAAERRRNIKTQVCEDKLFKNLIT